LNKAVLFDLDGVLVDACDWHYEALNPRPRNNIQRATNKSKTESLGRERTHPRKRHRAHFRA
jgi:beta-phosphoglucomutase-like phosphatase (HAD superfamily)